MLVTIEVKVTAVANRASFVAKGKGAIGSVWSSSCSTKIEELSNMESTSFSLFSLFPISIHPSIQKHSFFFSSLNYFYVHT
jgi:hypothetical protein